MDSICVHEVAYRVRVSVDKLSNRENKLTILSQFHPPALVTTW